MKRTLIRKTGLLVTILTMGLFASCVKDGWNPCNNKIRIVYDYNMERVDQFHIQASFFSLFVFDSETGLFEQEFKFTGNPFDKDYEIDVPQSVYGKKCDYIVWAGLDSDSYDFPQMQKGVSDIEDLKVKVKGYESQSVSKDLEPLWHGIISGVEFTAATERTETISLTKDTKTFRLVFGFYEDGEIVHPYELDDLDVAITSADGWYGYDNTVLDEKSRLVKYFPYVSEFEENAGLVYELNTLRLMADREATLVITDKSQDKEVFRMPLNSYLNLLRLVEESWVKDFQEYLDREDFYKIVIFIDHTNGGDPGENGNWASFNIIINDWVVREHGISGRLSIEKQGT